MSMRVTKLHKQYPEGKTAAVHDVSIEAPAGCITALLGPSGSGKTTLLRMIAGLESPDAGKIHFGPRELTSLPVQKRDIGFVFQRYALFAHLNVARNIAFGLEVRGEARNKIDARVAELIELVQLTEFAARFPEQLSGGQQQRVALARALAPSPSLLLLDEPFAALDARVRHDLRKWLRALLKQLGTTTLFVTHDQEEAFELADYVVVMNEGQVAQAGTPDEIYDHPASPFVASFIGNAHAVSHAGVDGKPQVSYVRPHEIKLRRPGPATENDAVLGVVEGLLRVTGNVRVDVRLVNGEHLQVHLPRAEADTLKLALGERVVVELGRKSVFSSYAI